MTTESGIQDPESGADRKHVFFWCCSTARAFLIMSVLVLNGFVSYITLGLARIPLPIAGFDEIVRIYCICSSTMGVLVSLMGLIGVFVSGVSGCGEIIVLGRRLRRKRVGQIFLAVFALPWLMLIVSAAMRD